MQRLQSLTRGLATAARLGWAIESNWTDPFIFMTYQIVRPLFGALIIVFMFKVVAGHTATALTFAQLYLGNALFILVIQTIGSIGQVIYELREHYETIRYIYLAPVGLGVYLAGHGLAKVAATTASVIITLLAGSLMFGVSYHLSVAALPYVLLVLVLGIVAMMAFGIALAAVTMVTAQHGFSMAEGAAGLLFLLCGAVFSIDILPHWVSAVSRVLPLTYWLEALRRVLLGHGFIESFSTMSDHAIFGYLVWTTAATVVPAWLLLRAAEHLALAKGTIDLKTDH